MKFAPGFIVQAVLAACLLAMLNPPAQAQQCHHKRPIGRPTIGLALGGGGARGFAHIGVLQVLEEMRVPFDYVAGTSMGSLVGGMVAVGMDSGEIITVIENADWDDLFSDSTEREDQPARRKRDDILGLYGPKLGVGKDTSLLPAGFVAGQKILFLFETVTGQRAQASHFDHLPVPFRAVATDIVTGQMVVLEDGSLSGAMRASMAVPGAFDPVRKDEFLLVDGGLVRNLPADIVRDMGADVVIAVDVGTPLAEGSEIKNVLHVVEQMTSLMIVANTERQIEELEEGDVLIRPDLGTEITSASFTKFDEAVPIGYAAAQEIRAALAQYSVSEAEYAAWRESIKRCVDGPPEVHFVRLNNESRFSDAVLENLITVGPGDTLDIEQLDHDIRQIYSLGFISLARYRVVEEDGQTGIEISVMQDERGTDFIETGLTIAGSGRGTTVNLQGAYLKTDLDERGSEARALLQLGDDFGLLVDYYRFLDDRHRWIFTPAIGYSRHDLLAFDPFGHAQAVAEIDQAGLDINIAREIQRHAIVRLGLSRYTGTADVTIGLPNESFHFDGGEWSLDLTYDRLDDLYLPTRGTRFNLGYIGSEESLGADEEFEQVRFGILHSQTFGRHNLLLTARYNTTLDDDAPLYALFTGGGFLNMSGFEPNRLIGQHFGLVGAGYRFQLNQSGLLPGYVGTTIEYGNAANERSDIFDEGIFNGSVYLGYKSPLGPIYMGYGWNEEGSGIFFLRLGAALGSQSVGRR